MILVQVASLTEIVNSNDGCNEDPDDILPSHVIELISSTLQEDRPSGQDLSGMGVPQAADKPALDDGVHSTKPEKSVTN